VIAIRKEQIELVEALASIKALEPALWARLLAGLQLFLGPETRHVIRTPPDVILVAQGRAQIAEDLLTLAAT
jgi:hypothetical protein